MPIHGRSSIGPSAYSFYADDLLNETVTGSIISTEKLLDFPLYSELSDTPEWDMNNASRTNDLWTVMASAEYGFILP
ncbi:MAG: hypothetical protein GY827_03450 [Cytophagales bacterium]|nr:hypothetical protein [Cytophagales bacterium]